MSVEMVTVGCKLPLGARLRLYNMVDMEEPSGVGGGMKTVKRAVVNLEAGDVVIHGNARPKEGAERPCLVVHGAALTKVKKDFWDAWVEQNSKPGMEHPWIKNNMLFAYAKEDHARAEARELVKERSGQEPLQRENDPRAKGRFKIEPLTRDADADE